MRVLLLFCTLLMFTSCYDPVDTSSDAEVETYSVTIFADEHGITVPTGNISLPLDSTLVVKATANENYLFQRWKQVGIDSMFLPDSSEALIRIRESESRTIALKAVFVPKICTVYVQGNSIQSNTPKDTLFVPFGEKITVEGIGREGYTFHKWSISDINALSTTSLVDEVLVVTVFDNGTITPHFLKDESETPICTLVVHSSDSAQSLTQKGVLLVPVGEKLFLSTKARTGYVFDRWKLSDVNSLLVSSLIEESVVVTVLGNGEIAPLFCSLHHEVTIDSAKHGTVSKVGTFTLTEHDSLEISATPNEHFRFVQWKQVGETTVPIADITAPTTYIRGVVGNGAIEAVFEKRCIEAFHSGAFLGLSTGSTLLTDLYDEEGRSLQIEAGDSLELHIKSQFIAYNPKAVEVSVMGGTANAVATVGELLDFMEKYLRDRITGPAFEGASVTLTPGGKVNVAIGGEVLTSIYLKNKAKPLSTTYVQNLFNWSGTITRATHLNSGILLRPATENDILRDLFGAQGRALGLEEEDEITLTGIFDGEPLPEPQTPFKLSGFFDPQRTVAEYITHLQSRFDSVMGGYFTVSINADNNSYPKGAIVIEPSETDTLTFSDIEVSVNNSNNNATSPYFFGENMKFTYVYKD